MDTPTDDTAVAAAIDTPLLPDTRADAPIRLLCCQTVYFWQDTRGVAGGECRRQPTMVRRQDDQRWVADHRDLVLPTVNGHRRPL